MGQHYGYGDEQEVERPDAQDATEIKPAQGDCARLLPLAQQDRGDEESAQGKEQVNPGRA